MKAKQGSGQLKRYLTLFLGLYLIYAGWHIFTGLNRGCDLDVTVLIMTPIRELYTYPMIDRTFAEHFTKPNLNDNPAMGLTTAVGMGISAVVKSALTLDGCLLVKGFLGVYDEVASVETPPPITAMQPTPRPGRPPFWYDADLIPLASYLRSAPQESAKAIAMCYKTELKYVYRQRGVWFGARCEGKVGWLPADDVELLD